MNRLPTLTLPLSAPSEETANQLTHGLGCLLSVVGADVLVRTAWQTGDSRRIVGCIVYAASLVLLYAASTLSHSFNAPRLRDWFRTLDQVCIFLMMAGSFTPFALAYLWNDTWSWLLAVMWGMALVGIGLKLFVQRTENVSVLFYVLVACLPFLAIWPMSQLVTGVGLTWILAGGAAYLIGVGFYVRDESLRYGHAVWHVCVIAGSVCHFMFMLDFVAKTV